MVVKLPVSPDGECMVVLHRLSFIHTVWGWFRTQILPKVPWSRA